MAEYTVMNPGKYHLGNSFNFPPIQNRKYSEKNMIKSIKWKTSALLGRRIYVGNVEIEDKDGKVKLFSDSIFKSQSNRFDTFRMDGRIDVAVGDGEEIIRLAGYADRLLQFKQNTLHIINANKDVEFLESTHKHKGVSHHNAVCETDYGVAWCNAHGVYMYNGQQIVDCFERQGVRIFSDDDWNGSSGFYKDGETMIGYIPDTRQLLVVRGNTDVSGNGDVMLYNMITQSWTKSTGRITREDKTNLVNIWDGKLVFGYESDTSEITVLPWKIDPSVAVNNYKIETKELNFGTQARKKISKVRITYKGGAGGNTNILPKYAYDGGDFNHSFQDENGTNITNIAGSANWAEIDLYTSSNANNIRSFGIQLTDVSGQDVASDFQINDITIIYRRKSVK